MPRVSIITPTINRQDLLPALWDCVRAQSVEDIEWLVFDGSPQRAPMFEGIDDPRVCYRHVADSMTIGAKRNALCDAATGEIISLSSSGSSFITARMTSSHIGTSSESSLYIGVLARVHALSRR